MRNIAWIGLALVLAPIASAEELPPIDAIVASPSTEEGAYWDVTAEDLAAYPAVARAVSRPDHITNLEDGELESTHAFFDEVMERDVLGIRLDGKAYSVGITLAHAMLPPGPQESSRDSPGPAALSALAVLAGVGAVVRRRG